MDDIQYLLRTVNKLQEKNGILESKISELESRMKLQELKHPFKSSGKGDPRLRETRVKERYAR